MNSAVGTAPIGRDRILLEGAARVVVRAAAACASYCEHAEHNEPATTMQVLEAAASLRQIAARLATDLGISLKEAYIDRIQCVQQKSLFQYSMTDGQPESIRAPYLDRVNTWAEAQVAQSIHDRQFHPDVFGLAKMDQLRHYTFHVTKLAGLIVDAIDSDTWDEFCRHRLPDVAIFGVKLSTVCNERLTAENIDLAKAAGAPGPRSASPSISSER